MDDLQILVDLHKSNPRLGPGSDAHTIEALTLAGLPAREGLVVADLGCGTGASALVLAKHLNAYVTAVDIFPEFLQELTRRAQALGLDAHISTLKASIDALPFAKQSLDVIWSEGAIYNLGFEEGLIAWRPFLKPGGVLAVSEITWLTSTRPEPIQRHWAQEYPPIDLASAKIALLEKHGFSPVGYFTLPESCWLDNYYTPLQSRFAELLSQYNHSDSARACVDAEQREIELYQQYKDYYSYGFYIARKL